MSLVMSIFTPDIAVMSGDYRRIHTVDKTIFFDDSPKVFKVNDRVILGLTGDVKASKYIIAQLSISSTSSLEHVSKHLARLYKKYKKENPDVFAIAHLVGISDNGKIKHAVISNDNNFKPTYTSAPKGEIRWMYSWHEINPEDKIIDEFDRLKDISPETLSDLLTKVNVAVGKKDVAVSEACDVIAI